MAEASAGPAIAVADCRWPELAPGVRSALAPDATPPVPDVDDVGPTEPIPGPLPALLKLGLVPP